MKTLIIVAILVTLAIIFFLHSRNRNLKKLFIALATLGVIVSLASDATDEWAVADLGDILIHIMIPEYRQRYSLETFLSELVENQKKKDIDPA